MLIKHPKYSVNSTSLSSLVAATLLVASFLASASPALSINSNAKTINAKSADSPEYKASLLSNQALQAIQEKRWQDARDFLEHAAILDPNQASCMVHTNLAQVLEHFNDFDGAFKHLTLALKFSPDDQSALEDMGSYYQQTGDLAKAKTYFERYLKIYPTSPDSVTVKQLLIAFKKVPLAKANPDETNYLKEADGDHLCRFQTPRGPLKIYFEPAQSIDGFQDRYTTFLKDALDQWVAATNVLSWRTVDSKDSADITCRFVSRLVDKNGKPMIECGQAQSNVFGEEIVSSTIILSTEPVSGAEVTDSSIKYLCLHEVGHALGLTGHSPHSEDIMFFSDRDREEPTLSERDKATISRLYATKITSTRPASSQLVLP